MGFYLLEKSIKNCLPYAYEYETLDSSREINYGAAFHKKSHSVTHYFTRLPNCVSGLGPKMANFYPDPRVPTQNA